jgi:hypothetical protein
VPRSGDDRRPSPEIRRLQLHLPDQRRGRASGKSTWARAWVGEDPKRRAEVNRDQLREMMHGGYVDAESALGLTVLQVAEGDF